jgi:predicted phage tail protein
VPAGFGVVAQPGRTPQAPRELLPAPALADLPAVAEELPIKFAWPKQKGGAAYRSQIAPDARFEKLVADRQTDEPSAEFGDLPDGDYVLRVRGIDNIGLEGRDALHPFTVNARPEPPVAAAPKDGGNAYTPKPKFWWSKPAQADHYHFQLAEQPAFDAPLIDLPLVQSSEMSSPQELALGKYYWRVATIDGQGEQGPHGGVQSFTVMEPAAAPEGPEAQLAEKAITFQWKPVKDAVRYQFQLAEDQAFIDELIDREVAENKITLTQEEFASGGEHFFRIRGITEDGSPGAWSTVHEIDIPSNLSPLWLLMLTLVLIPILL